MICHSLKSHEIIWDLQRLISATCRTACRIPRETASWNSSPTSRDSASRVRYAMACVFTICYTRVHRIFIGSSSNRNSIANSTPKYPHIIEFILQLLVNKEKKLYLGTSGAIVRWGVHKYSLRFKLLGTPMIPHPERLTNGVRARNYCHSNGLGISRMSLKTGMS